MSKQSKRRWRNRFIFLGVIVAAVIGYVLYLNSATMYDFTYLTHRMDFGLSRELVLLSETGEGNVPGKARVAQTQYIALYIDLEDTTFAIYDKRNGAIWHSSPRGVETVANPHHQGIMRSNMGFSYYDQNRRRHHRWMYPDSARYGPEQFTISSISQGAMNGVRIEYVVGNLDIGLHAIPRYLPVERHAEIYEYMQEIDRSEARFFRLQWRESEEHEGFMRLIEGIFGHVLNTTRMLNIFNRFDWNLYMTFEYNALVGYEPEISFDFFDVVFELMLDRDRMIVNVPVEGIQATGDLTAQVFAIDILRFFGAGDFDTEGFMLVPSGAGGVIRFNNGMYREPAFASRVYGEDLLMTTFFPQQEQRVRLPVIGINNSGPGMIAHVKSGSGLATVNAEVAAESIGRGGTTSQNNAWFSFNLRESMTLDMGGIPGGAGDMYVVQEHVFPGDITVVYQFLPGENATVGHMAQAYQQYLIERGVLTPLDGPGDRSFYLDILGAVDVRRRFLGTPYDSLEIMTDLADMNRFVDILNAGGVNKIQMQLHGWFNRGVNHDVAKRVNPIRGIGATQDMQHLHARLQGNGGGLHPVVNFQLTNWYSRNFQRALETARDPAGYIGFLSRFSRDVLITRGSIHRNDWFLLVHPSVLPQHIDRFIPNYERRVGIDGLMLSDMGDILTESTNRRNPVDREHSRLISAAQMNRLNEAFGNLVISGGNDYSLAFASHLVDVPTETDRFFIIDYEVPFFPMVVHGFIEFAGMPANMRDHYNSVDVLLNSMKTGASPRYILTAQPTRVAQFSPHERFYSTHYINWMERAINHYIQFNNVYRYLRGEPIVEFEVLAGRGQDILSARQVTVTTFRNGTRVYVNATEYAFEHNGVIIPPRWFAVGEV
ncbi:MAG: DUF5696 domain-containing protein [Defluviitaleaceae bacterium]|nr:DUF5696 domain-containing protein [Defluviitaleaceae bacterium]MCL2240272.1 DUF5696 domain-containing protein [Defluviitaleaceae bacterium]